MLVGITIRSCCLCVTCPRLNLSGPEDLRYFPHLVVSEFPEHGIDFNFSCDDQFSSSIHNLSANILIQECSQTNVYMHVFKNTERSYEAYLCYPHVDMPGKLYVYNDVSMVCI